MNTVDPILFELIKNNIDTIVDEMTLTMVRTAYSPGLRDVMDFSTAVCDAEGRMVAQGTCVALHLGSIPDAIAAVRRKFASSTEPGDLFIMNDPYTGGMHLPDVFFFKPVFFDGVLLAYLVFVGHQIDIGGRVPGSMSVEATEVFQEGLRIPPLKLYSAGRPVTAIWELIAQNVRVLAPRAPGVFSALGLAYANVERHLVRTHRVRLRGVTPEELEGSYDSMAEQARSEEELEGSYDSMAEQARSELVKIGWPADAVEIVRYADLRYQGQSSELRIAVDPGTLTAASLSRIEGAFQTEYERTYGHAQEASRAEIASLRVVARIAAESPTLPPINGAWSAAPLARRPAYFGRKLGFIDTRVISRLDLLGQQLAGPLIIEEYDSTVVVPPACTVSMDPRAMC